MSFDFSEWGSSIIPGTADEQCLHVVQVCGEAHSLEFVVDNWVSAERELVVRNADSAGRNECEVQFRHNNILIASALVGHELLLAQHRAISTSVLLSSACSEWPVSSLTPENFNHLVVSHFDAFYSPECDCVVLPASSLCSMLLYCLNREDAVCSVKLTFDGEMYFMQVRLYASGDDKHKVGCCALNKTELGEFVRLSRRRLGEAPLC